MCIQQRTSAAIKVIGVYFLISGGLGITGALVDLLKAYFLRPQGHASEPTVLLLVQLSPFLKPMLAVVAAFLCLKRTDLLLRKLGFQNGPQFFNPT